MSRISRCPGCTVMFKVVDDQLKVAEGWVRCGECGEVFDALQHVVGPDGAPIVLPGVEQALPLSKLEVVPLPAPVSEAEYEESFGSVRQGDVKDAALPLPLQPLTGQGQSALEAVFLNEVQSQQLAPEPSLVAITSQNGDPAQEPLLASDASAPDPAEFPGVAGFYAILANSVPADASLEIPDAVVEPSFVREADRQVFWQHPRVRIGLVVALCVLLLVLIVQWLAQEKNALVAREPRLAPVIAALCQPFGCAVRPLRQIEAVVVDSASFVKSSNIAYQLAFVLKNRSGLELEVPAVEVTLTDRQDQPLVRRVVLPSQFGVNLAAIGARAELPAGMLLKLANEPASPMQVAGYRIVAFYP